MIRPGRVYYEGAYEEWEEYLEKAAARARQQRAYAGGAGTPAGQSDSGELERL